MAEISAAEEQARSQLAASRPTSADAPAAHAQEVGIRVVTSRVQLALLIAMPIATAVGLIGFARDPMFASGLIAVIAVFVVFLVFASRVPSAFDRLQSRRVIQDKDVNRYRLFTKRTEELLNNWLGASVTGSVLALLAVARFPVQAGSVERFGENLAASVVDGRPLYLLDVIAESVLAFTLGFIAWRMIVIALRIVWLSHKFDLRLQVGHPDNCAGFRPLGDLCLWNGLLLTVPAIFLGFWLPLAPAFGYQSVYADLHLLMLGVLVVLATTIFVAPLWTVHIEMRRDAAQIRAEVDELGREIDRTSRELVREANKLTSEKITEMTTALEARRGVYHRTDQLPTWPIDFGIALKFSSAQIVPLLALTGMSEPILDAVGPIIDMFGG